MTQHERLVAQFHILTENYIPLARLFATTTTIDPPRPILECRDIPHAGQCPVFVQHDEELLIRTKGRIVEIVIRGPDK